MTSSLVGSEMCIRDSNYYSPTEPPQMQLSIKRSDLCLIEEHRDDLLHDCLLYTSDAADDM
eukprot:113283-Prorocentrum_lima.AAC.1